MSGYPEHQNPTDVERTATAPYNFVPLPRQVYEVDGGIDVAGRSKLTPWITHDQWLEGTLSGWIDLEIETLTPLYIRDFARRDAQGMWDGRASRLRPDPARTPNGTPTPSKSAQVPDGRPLIPGSSLRGMTRALVEILSFSKIAPVTTNRPFFRTFNKDRVGDAYGTRMVRGDQKPQGGFLRIRSDGVREIVPCVVYRVKRDDLPKTIKTTLPADASSYPDWNFQHHRCYVRLANQEEDVVAFSLDERQDSGWQLATLVITGAVPPSKKAREPKREFVFLDASPNAQAVSIPDAIWDRFHDDDQITQWQERAFPKDPPKPGSRKAPGWLRDGEPVFYLTDAELKQDDNPAGLLFLGRAQMFRFPYDLSPYELIPEKLRTAKLDLAEAMFGQVARERGSTQPPIKGRLRFEDAVALDEQHDMYEQLVVPRVLSSPKPTTYPHYLVQDGTQDARQLATYLKEDSGRTSIRGHKLYWHRWGPRGIEEVKEPLDQQGLLRDLQTNQPRDTQHTIIHPVRSGIRFGGRVHFENLTPLELGALLTALHLPDECAHKLGMAKPLGLGSVRVTPKLHVIDRTQRYASWLGDGAKEDDGATFLETFAGKMLRHAQGSLEPRFAGDRSIWQITRLAALYVLLRWERRPEAKATMPMVLQPQRNDFRARKVLPTPYGVDRDRPPWLRELDTSSQISGSVRAPAAGPLTVGQTYSWATIDEKTKKGDWRFQLKGSTVKGHLIDPKGTPPEVQPGVEFALEVRTGGRRANDYGLRWNGSGALPSKVPPKKGGPLRRPGGR